MSSEGGIAGRPRVLVVNNASFAREGERLWIAPPTGRFLVELAALGFRVRTAQTAASHGPQDRRSDFDLAAQPGVAVAALPWPLGPLGRLAGYLRALPWMLREVGAADFVYVFLPGHLPLMFVAGCRLLGRPYALLLRGELSDRRLRFALRAARFVLATSEPLRDAARSSGLDAELATPMLEVSAADVVESRPPRAAGPWRLLFVGRVETSKGLPELLEATAELGRRGRVVELHVVGWALEFERHRADAERRDLANVRFHGAISHRDRLLELYDRADVFVMPSRSEGFPRVLYEAMARRLPIVTTFVGGIASRMRDGVDCVRAPLRDGIGLADAIDLLLGDAELRERVAAGGTAAIRAAFGAGRPSHAAQVAARLAAGRGPVAP